MTSIRTPLQRPTMRREARSASVRATLGTAQLGTGLVVAGSLLVAMCLLVFALRFGTYPRPAITGIAWILLLFVMVGAVLITRHNGYLLTNRAASTLMLALAVVVTIDLAGVWGETGARYYPTAAIAVGGVLLAAATLRPVREIATSTIVLGVVLAATLLFEPRGLQASVSIEILMLATAIGTPLVACAIVASYRRMVMMALDRVLIQSTVTASAFGSGTLETDELRALDLEAEKLFDDVASGREPLPLSEERAAQAAELATALRMSLVAGRSRTWLHHAISESDVLSESVTVRDPDAHAALLDQQQRDGLLSAIWFFMTDDVRNERAATVTFTAGASEPQHAQQQVREALFGIAIEVDGLRRTIVDPAAWDNVARVGSYVDTATARGLRVEIECRVMNRGAS